MKKKVLVVMVLCVMGLTALSIGNADAAPWYTCTITRVGVTGTSYYAMLSDTNSTPAFSNRFFVLDPTMGKELLATVLTAFSSGSKLWCYIGDTTQYSLISDAFSTNE